MTALAVLIRPESVFWKFLLWGGIAIFIACACIVMLDYFRPNGSKILLCGVGIGITLLIVCTIAFFQAVSDSPTTSGLAPAYVGKIEAEKVKLMLSAKDHKTARTIEIGNSGTRFLLTGPEGAPFLEFADNYNLTIESIDGDLKVSTKIRNRDGQLIAELMRNEWKVAPPPKTWDRNYNNSALEVKDDIGSVVLQVKALSDRIQIQGEWWRNQTSGFRLVATPTGANMEFPGISTGTRGYIRLTYHGARFRVAIA